MGSHRAKVIASNWKHSDAVLERCCNPAPAASLRAPRCKHNYRNISQEDLTRSKKTIVSTEHDCHHQLPQIGIVWAHVRLLAVPKGQKSDMECPVLDNQLKNVTYIKSDGLFRGQRMAKIAIPKNKPTHVGIMDYNGI